MDLTTIVREEATKRLGSEAEIKAFMEGFEKQAAFLSPTFLGEIGSALPKALAGAGVSLGAALVGAAAVKGINSGNSFITRNALNSKFEMALQHVKSNNKIVKGANPTKVDSYAKTLFNFAPNVASDVNLLDTLLTNAVHGEGVDASILKSVTDLESRYRENNSSGPLPGIRA